MTCATPSKRQQGAMRYLREATGRSLPGAGAGNAAVGGSHCFEGAGERVNPLGPFDQYQGLIR